MVCLLRLFKAKTNERIFLSGSLHPNVDRMLEKFIRGKEYQSAKYEEARGVLELRFGIVNFIDFSTK